MYAEFDNSLITGNKTIDEQHKELISKINQLLGCCKENGGKVEAVKMLDYLSDYTDFHFGEEEHLQEKVSYPGIMLHKEKHAEFRKAVNELYDMLREEEGPTDAFVDAVTKNVRDWLYDHIKGFDYSVAAYINLHSNADLI